MRGVIAIRRWPRDGDVLIRIAHERKNVGVIAVAEIAALGWRMKALSSLVESAQVGLHPKLDGLLQRHFEHPWLEPLHAPSVRAFDHVQQILTTAPRALVLDSGCGTGSSTLRLAEQFPDHWVIGVDQSAARLAALAPMGFARHGNALLLRAELATFWRLFIAAGWRADKNFLLYPNPWPKPAQVIRRWHGHPVFPELMRTADAFELRSNWAIYVDEFAVGLRYAARADVRVDSVIVEQALTPFEKKYRESGHPLWQVTAA